MKVVSIFHNKLEELQNQFPLFRFQPINEKIRTKGKDVVYRYCVDLSEDVLLYLNYEKEDIDRLSELHSLAIKIKEFNETYENLKVYIEDPATVWISGNDGNSPVAANFADFCNEKGKFFFKGLNEKSGFIKENKDFFVCRFCYSIKNKSFMYADFLKTNTCVACVEVYLDEQDC